MSLSRDFIPKEIVSIRTYLVIAYSCIGRFASTKTRYVFDKDFDFRERYFG